jgi:radical SAM superfamily enzyme YgiQ (UPF0313 family)
MKMLKKKALSPPLGLLTVAALLPDNWKLKLVDLNVRQISEQEWSESDIVMISGMFVQQTGIFACIGEAKKRNKKVVVGGPMSYHDPERILAAGADLVVKGEAETTMAALLEHLQEGHSDLIISSECMADIEKSPAPRIDLLDSNAYADLGIQFSRGCPFKCEFCDITLMLGREVRTKTTYQIISELEALYRSGWRRSVFFVDDNFIGNPKKTKELLRVLIPWMEKRSYPFDFYTQASINLALDNELLNMMVRAGFNRVFLGIESTDRPSLIDAKKFQNAAQDIDAACRKINQAGIQIIAGFIMGFDKEQPGMDRRLIDFANRNSIPEMFVTPLQAAPGTDLWHRLERENRLFNLTMDDNLSSQTALPNFATKRPVKDIMMEFIHIYEELYDEEAFLDRTFSHFFKMAPPPFEKGIFLPTLAELRAVTTILFRRGVLYNSRLKFWKFLWRAFILFPKRVPQYFTTLVVAEHYLDFKMTIKRGLMTHLAGKER